MALVFAAAHPERTKALVLFNSFARLAAAPDYPEGLTGTTGMPVGVQVVAPAGRDATLIHLAGWLAPLLSPSGTGEGPFLTPQT